MMFLRSNDYELGALFIVSSSVVNLILSQRLGFAPLTLIPVFGSVQLILAFILLSGESSSWNNYGPLSVDQYIKYSSLGVFCFLIPFFEWGKASMRRPARITSVSHHKSVVFLMIIWGFVAEVISFFAGSVPVFGAIGWYFTLLWKLAIIIAFFDTKQKTLASCLFCVLFLKCLMSSLYWEFFMTCVIGSTYGLSKGSIRIGQFAGIALLGLSTVLVIQSFKHYQRTHIEVDEVAVISDLVFSLGDEEQRKLLAVGAFGRLNQGIHDSFVYDNCGPAGCGKQTIAASALGVFIPRFFFKEKPGFNSSKLQMLGNYWGMGMSFITVSGCAEAFANFGLYGGAFFMLCYSFFLLRAFKWCQDKFGHLPSILLIIPFYHVLRVEVDFYHWFSGLVYGTFALLTFDKIILRHWHKRPAHISK
jgi:hypothetical protein